MMKARTKFLKMYWKLPDKARGKLAINWNHYGSLMTLRVMKLEVEHNTMAGVKALYDLGYEDDKNGQK